jgi:hypothetical protein
MRKRNTSRQPLRSGVSPRQRAARPAEKLNPSEARAYADMYINNNRFDPSGALPSPAELIHQLADDVERLARENAQLRRRLDR